MEARLRDMLRERSRASAPIERRLLLLRGWRSPLGPLDLAAYMLPTVLFALAPRPFERGLLGRPPPSGSESGGRINPPGPNAPPGRVLFGFDEEPDRSLPDLPFRDACRSDPSRSPESRP